MSIINLLLFYVALQGRGEVSDKMITVIGTAQNAKAGAVVIAKGDKKMYYVDGLAAWQQGITGKPVKVTGELLVENIPPQQPGSPVRQQITGIKRTILHPKWEFLP